MHCFTMFAFAGVHGRAHACTGHARCGADAAPHSTAALALHSAPGSCAATTPLHRHAPTPHPPAEWRQTAGRFWSSRPAGTRPGPSDPSSTAANISPHAQSRRPQTRLCGGECAITGGARCSATHRNPRTSTGGSWPPSSTWALNTEFERNISAQRAPLQPRCCNAHWCNASRPAFTATPVVSDPTRARRKASLRQCSRRR